MLQHRYSLAFIYRIIYLLICGYGLFLHFFPFSYVNSVHMLSYYTIQSNILCFISCVLMIILSGKKVFSRFSLNSESSDARIGILNESFCYVLCGMALLSIILTCLVYHISSPLAKNEMYGAMMVRRNFYVHYMTPALAKLDWILFVPKNIYHLYSPFLFAIPTVVYGIELIIMCYFYNCSAPYSFLKTSFANVLSTCTYLGIFLIITAIICLLILYLDRHLG